MTEYRSGEDIKRVYKAVLKAEGITTTEVGERMGTSQGNISRAINRLNPTFGVIRDLCEAIGYKLVFDIVKADSEN